MIDEKALNAAKVAFAHDQDADIWDRKMRAAITAYMDAAKAEPAERPMQAADRIAWTLERIQTALENIEMNTRSK